MKFYFLSALFFFSSCLAQTNENQKAIDLNDKAIKLYNNYSRETSMVEDVLKLLDDAIDSDSLYWVAYYNKANILSESGRCYEALITLDNLILQRPDIVSALGFSGLIFERMGQTKQAENRYIQTIAKYDSIIQKGEDSLIVYFEIDRVKLLFLTNGNEEGIKAFEILKSKYPNDDYIINQAEFFYNFNREELIGSPCK